MNPTSLTDLLPDDLLSDPIHLAVVLLVIGLLISRIPTSSSKTVRQQQRRAERGSDIKRTANTGLLRRLTWKVRRPHDLMQVDGLTIDRTGKRSHCLWPGPTGVGKSASVAAVRCDGRRPVLAIMPDLSDPLRAKADFIWTACEPGTRVNFLIGTPDVVAERLTEVFRSGGNGVWKMAAREAATHVIRDLDAAKTPRTLRVIGEGLEELVESNRRLKTACEGWVTRFLATAMAMGDSVGAGGVDIADLLNAGKMVVIDNDIWKHPGLGGDVVAFGLAEAKRVADLVPGGFRLIFEEADQLGDRIDLADPFFAAGRRRMVAVDAMLHAEDDASPAIATNTATRVYFRPNQAEQRAKVAKALDMTEGQVDSIPDFHAWVEHDGKVRRLVHFPKPPKTPKSRPSVADGITKQERMGETDDKRRMAPRWTLVEEPQWEQVEPVVWEQDGQRMLPPPSSILQKLLISIYPEGSCERWGGKHDKDGYGLVWLDGRWQKVHRVRWEMAYGAIPRNDDGTTQTVDHIRGMCVNKDCSKLVHLRLLTRSANSKDRWSYRGRQSGSGGKAKSSGRKG